MTLGLLGSGVEGFGFRRRFGFCSERDAVCIRVLQDMLGLLNFKGVPEPGLQRITGFLGGGLDRG